MNYKRAYAIILLLGMMLSSCHNSLIKAPVSLTAERRNTAYLEQDYAKVRAQQIRNVHYDLNLDVEETKSVFSGYIAIHFNLAPDNHMPVTVDFDNGEVESITLNGHTIPWRYETWFISIAPELFQPGDNKVEIVFKHAYATAGDGLHRYKDAETGNVYLYSNFEPFNAHKMFPHFDQPDIKARFNLQVTAPQQWQVISTTRETLTSIQGNKKQWIFAQTPLMASYVFSTHAGPYAVWVDNSGSVPLRLFSRQEIAQYVNASEWFSYTKKAFEFYNQYFEYPYPFKKYDQLIVPDFNSGAMENIAAVTFNENYVSRGSKTYLARMRNANVIAHEMAHMWFGDLVTMEWWNGLWLNESFATYMATLQQATNSEFKTDAWSVFYADTKQWGYTSDQQVATHAIELPVANTAEAFTNFDGITYGKGAAVLKQLSYYVGEENFRRGVVSYLKKYAYSNTRLADFMGAVAKSSNINLTDWAQEWLYTAGLNTITLDIECKNNGTKNVINHFDIVQIAPEKQPVLRRQRVQLGFYYARQNTIELTKLFSVIYQGERSNLHAVEGLECPLFVYPNVADWGYVKVKLDQVSRQNLSHYMNHFDAGLRKMLWENVWDEVESANLPLADYIEMVQTNIAGEADVSQIAAVLSKLQSAYYYLWMFTHAGQDHRPDLAKLERITAQQLARAEVGSDMQKVSFDAYVGVAHTPATLEVLHNYLLGINLPEGLVLDQDRRWAVIKRLNQFEFQDYRELTQQEQQKDKSDTGQQMALASEAIRPEFAIKERWVKEILSPTTSVKLATLRQVMRALFPVNQLALRQQFDQQLFDRLPELQARNNERFLFNYANALLTGGACSSVNLRHLMDVRDQYANLGPTLNKVLSINVQEEQRCVDMMKVMVAQ